MYVRMYPFKRFGVQTNFTDRYWLFAERIGPRFTLCAATQLDHAI